MLKIRKGGFKDLNKYYTMMEVDFEERELIGKITLEVAQLKGNLDFYVAYDDESKIDLGYALVFTKSVYDYIIIKYLGIFPWYRAKGVGKDMLKLLLEKYPDKKGAIVEIPVFEENDEAQINKLTTFFKKQGFENVKSDYRIGGAEVILMCRPIKGSADIEKYAHRIILDIYSRFIPADQIDITKV